MNDQVNGFVVFTREFDSTKRHYLRVSKTAKDEWTPELKEASILPHVDAFRIARQYRKARFAASVGRHGKLTPDGHVLTNSGPA